MRTCAVTYGIGDRAADEVALAKSIVVQKLDLLMAGGVGHRPGDHRLAVNDVVAVLPEIVGQDPGDRQVDITAPGSQVRQRENSDGDFCHCC